MRALDARGVLLHWRERGDASGAPVVFANSLGTDLRLWDAVVARLPAGTRAIRFDLRGHGLSACPPGPYAMGELSGDLEALLDGLGVRGCVLVGLSIGGMIAQDLASRRPDLVRALVLACTAARMGTPDLWAERMAAVRAGGVEAVADAVLARWFAGPFRARPEAALWRAMLARTPAEGYAGCCAAIAGADLSEAARALRRPALCVAGSQDGASPPELVRATAELIPGARFEVIEGAGHLPPVEAPEAFAALVIPFLEEHAHA